MVSPEYYQRRNAFEDKKGALQSSPEWQAADDVGRARMITQSIELTGTIIVSANVTTDA